MMLRNSTINLDCRDALRCILTAVSCLDASNRDYWVDEARIYDLRMIGGNPYGFNTSHDMSSYVVE